jgi:hypothetical protein
MHQQHQQWQQQAPAAERPSYDLLAVREGSNSPPAPPGQSLVQQAAAPARLATGGRLPDAGCSRPLGSWLHQQCGGYAVPAKPTFLYCLSLVCLQYFQKA